MTMTFSAPLQAALYDALVNDPALVAAEAEVFDAAPHAARRVKTAPYVMIGEEIVAPWGDGDGDGAMHEAKIRVYAPAQSFAAAKTLAAAIASRLTEGALPLTNGRVALAEFVRAEATLEARGAMRRVDLSIRFAVEPDPVA